METVDVGKFAGVLENYLKEATYKFQVEKPNTIQVSFNVTEYTPMGEVESNYNLIVQNQNGVFSVINENGDTLPIE